MRAVQRVSIIVPTYNEADNVVPLLKRIDATFRADGYPYEVIVIDDHSTDGTLEALRKLAKKYPLRAYLKVGRKGKAYSLLEGFAHAQGDLVAILDADLQYPPEAFLPMLTEIESGYDIVVARRQYVGGNRMRQALSRGFQTVFGRRLHGLSCDVQSGQKLFRRAILDSLHLNPTPWSFDLEFLSQAAQAGYSVGEVAIDFQARTRGESKVNLLSTAWELARTSLALKLRAPQAFPRPDGSFFFRGKQFHAQSPISSNNSALYQTDARQSAVLLGLIAVVIVALILNWHLSLEILIGTITSLYFSDLLFNLFLICRSFSRNPELSVADDELDEPLGGWPMYTIFCPLYKEWEVVPQFVTAMSRLDYPHERLQVLLLLEEDDVETVSKCRQMDLPAYFEIVVVPDSMPKTKPKACNYGLKMAAGTYTVIYDAEDVPDANQLKQAVIAFGRSKPEIVCIQAKLNFYNPRQNLLTRLFTAEYSLWFDLVLTGLMSVKAPIPLGGTSNHFRTSDLHRLEGWDAFNVTEDCDLGLRLAKLGYRTAVLDSTTWEEANSDTINWYKQRSRWIKGYIQSYIVHMRQPGEFLRSGRILQFIGFQAIVGGKVLSLFVNPLMWLLTVSYFVARPWLGATIDTFFPAPVLYMAVFSLFFGNFLYLYYYMIGCAKRGYFDLLKYVAFVPLYWLGMSIAAWRALYEIIYMPHFWAKTKHGLHLASADSAESAAETLGVELVDPELTGSNA